MNRFEPQHMRGFTLIELAVVITIVGLLSIAAIGFAIPTIKTARTLETQNKITQIQTALRSYAMTNYRLPCPANPDRTPAGNAAPNDPPWGFERGSGIDGNVLPNGGCGNLPNNVGVVPFGTLGLSEEDVKDGWGNMISYHVSNAFTQNPSNASLEVFASCRTADWMYEDTDDITRPAALSPGAVRNRAPLKARFCCPGRDFTPDTDWVVVNENDTYVLTPSGANSASPPSSATSRSTNASLYRTNVDVPYPDPLVTYSIVVANNEKSTGIAYVLISHGAEGGLAFNPATGARYAATDNINNWDSQNDSNDRILYDVRGKRVATGAAQPSDDIVVWETQDMMMASVGQSCVFP